MPWNEPKISTQMNYVEISKWRKCKNNCTNLFWSRNSMNFINLKKDSLLEILSCLILRYLTIFGGFLNFLPRAVMNFTRTGLNWYKIQILNQLNHIKTIFSWFLTHFPHKNHLKLKETTQKQTETTQKSDFHTQSIQCVIFNLRNDLGDPIKFYKWAFSCQITLIFMIFVIALMYCLLG